jgi:hypothetical protein
MHLFLNQLPDPDTGGSSEYRALHDFLHDQDYEDEDDPTGLAASSCGEMAEWACNCVNLLTPDPKQRRVLLTGEQAATVHAALKDFQQAYPADGKFSLSEIFPQYDVDPDDPDGNARFEPLSDEDIDSLTTRIAETLNFQ